MQENMAIFISCYFYILLVFISENKNLLANTKHVITSPAFNNVLQDIYKKKECKI